MSRFTPASRSLHPWPGLAKSAGCVQNGLMAVIASRLRRSNPDLPRRDTCTVADAGVTRFNSS